MTRRRVQYSVLATSIIAMVLQLLVASAHIHGLDGDTYHHGFSRTDAETPAIASRTVDLDVKHGRLSDDKDHTHHHDSHRDKNQNTVHETDDHVHVNAHVDDEHQRHSNGDHAPAQACDFCWLFGALSSLDTPCTATFTKPTTDKTVIPPHAVENFHAGILTRANRTRAPPSIT
ncbi:MAG: DUF2946 domain-containing protein [Hyphomicrobiaceae bacterium]